MENEQINRDSIEIDRDSIEIDRKLNHSVKVFIVKLLAICALPFIAVIIYLIMSVLWIFAIIAGLVYILFRFGQ